MISSVINLRSHQHTSYFIYYRWE